MAFELPALPYAFDALEPHIDGGAGGRTYSIEFASKLHPGKERLPGGIDRFVILTPPPEHLIHNLAILAEHLRTPITGGRIPGVDTDRAVWAQDKDGESGCSGSSFVYVTSEEAVEQLGHQGLW